MAFEIENGVFKKYIPEDGNTEIIIPEGVTELSDDAFGFDRYSKTFPDRIIIPRSLNKIGYDTFDNVVDYTGDYSNCTIVIYDVEINLGALFFCDDYAEVATIEYEDIHKFNDDAYDFYNSAEQTYIHEVVSVLNSIISGEFDYYSDYLFYDTTSRLIENIIVETGNEKAKEYLNNITERYIKKRFLCDREGIIDKFIGSAETYSYYYDDEFGYIKYDETVVIPECISNVGGYAFEGWDNIDTVVIKSNQTEISEYAFSNCGALAHLYLPDGLVNIGENAFESTLILEKSENGFVIIGILYLNTLAMMKK